ncbi:MAG: HINT domain-containing protein [Henriciella sp.]|nr:HINT domain-containing protein [Henriciella sp.]
MLRMPLAFAKRLLSNGAKWAVRKAKKVAGKGGCGCFTAGTLVWAAAGQIPIQDISVGDWVLARDANQAMVFRQVTDEIITRNAALLHVSIEHEDGRFETLSTTDGHPFWVKDGRGFIRADELSPGDILKASSGQSQVRQISISAERQTVYNLTVDDVHTYLVGPDGVLVHNSPCNFNFITKRMKTLRPGRGPNIYEVDTEIQLRSLFDELSEGGTAFSRPGYNGGFMKLPDGTEVGFRNSSGRSSGGLPTIDVFGQEKLKIHITYSP